ncbi:MAG: ankyrin repeat domain-containing protein [Betaproteobacteria bacterium]
MIFGLFGGDKKRVAEMIAAARAGDTEKVKQLLSKGADINAPEPESGDTPLLAAIDKGQWATAEYLLKQRPDLNLEDKNGNSPLYLAVSRGDSALAMVNLLLEAGAPVELGPKHGDNAGATPLHIACATGANGCLESLLRHRASATKQLPSGATPLHTAAIGGDQRTIELLCKAGGSVTALNEDKRTPLHNCGITGNAKVAVALIQQGAPVETADAEGCTPLMRAVMKNHAEVAKVLLDHGADPDVVVRTDSTPLYPLFVAAMNGYDDVVRVLLDKGANVTAKVEGVPSPVDAAKHNGHEAAAKLIAAAVKKKKAEAKAEKDGNELQSQLEEAWTSLDGEALRKIADSRLFGKLPAISRLSVLAVNGDLAGVNSVLASGLKPDLEVAPTTVDVPPVIAASMRKGNVDVVGVLLAAGANPNVLRADGSSALLVASSNGDTEVVKALLAAGANPNHALPNGQTVLMSAVVNGQGKVIDLLIDAGADVNALFPEGRFGAFALALDNKKMRIALQLLRRDAQPSFGDSDTLPLAVVEHGSLELLREIDARGGSNLAGFGARAAFVAARNKDPEVLDYLLSHGVELSAGNDLGYTPLILATLANHPSLVQRYADRGDDLNARDIDGETALSLAIEKDRPLVAHILLAANAETKDYGDVPVAEALLRASSEGALGTILKFRDRGGSINCTDDQGNTPLMLAARAGFVGVVRSLYHLGADINHRNLAGKSASNLAKESDQEKVLKTLMEFGADDALHDVYGINPPDAAEGSRKTIDMADTLMGRYSHPFKDKLPYDEPEDSDDSTDEEEDPEEPHVDEDEEVEPELSDDVSSKLDQLEALINTPHIRDKLPEGHHEGITDRINLIRSQGEDAVPRAQLDDLFELAEFLASQPESEEPPPPLFEAATEGDLQQFRKLIKAGADFKETMPDGTTLLMTAAENGHNDIAQELVKLGVDVNQRRQDTFSAFLIACFLGHDDVVKTLAKHGADVNAAYEIGSSQGSSGNQTALTVAAARGNCPMCSLLLKLGADLNVVSDSGYTPLMWSLANGASEDAAELLLKAGANPDPDAESRIAISTSTTPLILASTNGMTAIVKAMLKRNVAVDKTDGDGWTALKRASNEGHEEVLNLLLKAGASPNIADHEGWTALINAAGKGHVEVCKALLKAGADVNATGARGRTPLLQAIGARSDGKALNALKELKRMLSGGDGDEDGDDESSLDLVKALLKAGANPNVLHDGASLLSEAIENDDEELVKLLKKHGATEAASQASIGAASEDDPESEEGNVLLAAAVHADTKTIHGLVRSGIDVNFIGQPGQTALGVLVFGLHDESRGRLFYRNAHQCIDLLLRHGARPSLGNPCPFLMAAMGRRLHLVNSMLSVGVDINQSIGEGQTALFLSLLAPDAGQPVDDRCALALLNAGADSSLKHESGAMPIHLAAGSNYLGALQALLDRRPQDVDAKTNIGITPLMMAATEGHVDAVRLLLKFGADRTLKDDEGLTAKEVAIKNGNDQLIPLLG